MTARYRERILEAIADLPADKPFYGYQLMQATGLDHNNVKPTLDWLIRMGYVTLSWDTNDGRSGARRKLLTLTTTGLELLLGK